MERVQFQQEQMLAELKDLVQKGLFTKNEIRQIMKRRTTFETALVRRIPKKSDFLRYAAYEMSLEALRRKRVERLRIPKGPPTISDYALIRRQFQIFERALKKFRDDISLWVQYIQAAQHGKARALVSRICGRALQLHPNEPALYILAASHELKHLSHAAARILLQRGLRMNRESVELWREYVKMELGFMEALRRRWNVLGLKVGEDSEGKAASQDVDMQDADETEGNNGNDEALAEADDNDEQARKEILNGALVKTVISSAAKAIPAPELFISLHSVLSTYPCPPPLRRSLLDYLHSLLYSTPLTSPDDPGSSFKPVKLDPRSRAQAAKLYATRYLTPDLEGDALVDALRKANEELMELVRRKKDAEVASAYAQFISEWFEKGVDEHLNMYLVSSLQTLCSSSRSPSLYAALLRLLRSPQNPNRLSEAKLLKLARKYTSRCSTNVDLWLLRLGIEYELESKGDREVGADWKVAWEEARKKFIRAGVVLKTHEGKDVDEIWLWGVEHQRDRPLAEQIAELESLLGETRSDPSSSLTEELLIRYIRLSHRRALLAIETSEPTPYKSGDEARDIAHLASRYLPSEHVWEAAFDIYSNNSEEDEGGDNCHLRQSSTSTSDVNEEEEKERALRTIYDTWRLISPSAHGAAALKWAGWLLNNGKGGEATKVIANARTILAMDEEAASKFDRMWRDVVDEFESENRSSRDGNERGKDSDDE